MAAHRWIPRDKGGKFVYIYELNPPIVQTMEGMAHVAERHTHNGVTRYLHKSKFNFGENIAELIASAACQQIVLQPSVRYARIHDAGRDIGFDRNIGTVTRFVTVITVITDVNGDLTTAFPGNP